MVKSKKSAKGSKSASTPKKKSAAAATQNGATTTATPASLRASLAKLGKTAMQAKFKEVFGRAAKSDNVHHLREAIAKKLAPTRPVASAPESGAAAPPARDPRLPAVGTLIKREYRGVTHEVKVLDDSFSYGGERHRSLSGIARLITGQETNGFLWFGLLPREKPKAAPTKKGATKKASG